MLNTFLAGGLDKPYTFTCYIRAAGKVWYLGNYILKKILLSFFA